MRRAFGGACIYFAAAFAAGVVLGALRTLLVAPVLGATTAVLVELPAILAISWFACGLAIRVCGVGPGYDSRAAMGLAAFGLLIAAEFVLGAAVFGRTLAEQLAAYGEPAGALGLAAQIVFGAFPLFRR